MFLKLRWYNWTSSQIVSSLGLCAKGSVLSMFHKEVVETIKICAAVETSCCCVVSRSMSGYTSRFLPILFEFMCTVVFSIVHCLCEVLLTIYLQSSKAMAMYRVPSVIAHNNFLIVDDSLSWELNPKTCYCYQCFVNILSLVVYMFFFPQAFL